MGRQRRQRAGFIRQTRPHSPRPARFWHLVPSHAPRLRPPHCRNISTGCPGSNSWTARTGMGRAAGSTQGLRSNAADTAVTIQLWRPAPHRQTSSPVFSTWRLSTNPPWCSDRKAMSPAGGAAWAKLTRSSSTAVALLNLFGLHRWSGRFEAATCHRQRLTPSSRRAPPFSTVLAHHDRRSSRALS